MAKAKSVLKWGAIGLGALLLLSAGGATAGFLWLQGNQGKAWLAHQIEEALSTPGETEVSIGSLEGALPRKLKVSDVAVGDGEGNWLTIATLAVDWNPWQLFHGTLEIDALALTGVELARLPAEATPDDDKEVPEPASGGIPRLPVDVALHLVTVDEIVLGAPVLGQPARFTLAGKASGQEDGSFGAGLDLRRLDGPDGKIGAELIYDSPNGLLTAQVNAGEAPGGLLASLLDLPDLPGTEMKLTGSGPLDSWQGDFSLSLGDLIQAEAALALTRDNDGLTLKLDGHSESAPRSPAPLARLAAGRTDFALEATWQEGPKLQISRLAVTNEQLALKVDGDISPETGSIDLKIDAETRDGSLLAELAEFDSLGPIALDLTVTGSINRPEAEIEARAGRISSADLDLDAVTAKGRIAASSDLLGSTPMLSLNLAGQLQSPRLPGQDDINALLGESLPWSLQGELDIAAARLDLAQLDLAPANAKLTASGPLDLAAGAANLEAELVLPDATALQPLTFLRLGGQISLRGPVKLTDFGSQVSADLKGRWTEPSSEVALIGLAAGKAMELQTQLSISDGTLQLKNTSARSQRAGIDLDLTLTPDSELRDTRYAVELPDASFLSAELGADISGAARATGSLSGPFDDLAVEGDLNLAHATVAEQPLARIAGRYKLRLQDNHIDGPVSIALTSPFGPVEAQSAFKLRDDALTLGNLKATLPSATVTAEVQVPLAGGEPIANLQGDIKDLGPWLKIADLNGSGHGTVSVRLNGPSQSNPVLANADLSAVTLVTAPGATPVSAESLSLQLRATDPALEQPASFTLKIEKAARDQIKLAQLEVAGQGTRDDLALTLNTTGQWIDPFDLRAAGALSQTDNQTEVRLTEVKGTLFEQPLQLRQTARLIMAPSEIRLESLDVVSGETELVADARLGGDQIAVTATLGHLPMKTVNAFWDSGITGMISGDMKVSGNLAAPVGEARLTATGLHPAEDKDLPELALEATADWRDGRAKLVGQLSGPQVDPASFNLEGPLAMTPDGGITVPGNGALAGHIDWSGKIASLAAIAPLPQHRVSGDGEIHLSLGGTPTDPAFDGKIEVSKGRYESLEYGTALRDIELLVTLAEDKVSLARFSANDSAAGKITGQGGLSVDPERDFPLDLSLKLEKFRALHMDEATALLGGSVLLNGTMNAPRVEARLTTETVEINLANALPASVATLDVVEIKNGVVQQMPKEDQAKAAAIDAALDVVVDMPHKVFVRGRGLDSEWAGRIMVEGSSADPKISGNVNLVRGQLSLIGKTFSLDKGRVDLPASANSEPTLDVTASHKGKELDVTARLTGPLTKPEMELTSSPEVPRDEIISRVLFNKSAGELTAGEAAQLALAVRDLTGKGGGTDILGFARRNMGVDVLRVNTDDDGKAAVEAGKYLTDKVYLGVKQGSDSESSSAGVEVELTPNVTVESEVTRGGANKSGVRFKLDY